MRRDLIALPDNSRVWIYKSSERISETGAEKIKQKLYDFTMQWKSHGQEVDCYAHLFHNQFLVFVADENNHVSGCSIDSSVHFLQAIEKEMDLSLFDRLNYAYLEDDVVKQIPHNQFKEAYERGLINNDTLMFDNLVNNKTDFINDWLKPLDQSWYLKFVN